MKFLILCLATIGVANVSASSIGAADEQHPREDTTVFRPGKLTTTYALSTNTTNSVRGPNAHIDKFPPGIDINEELFTGPRTEEARREAQKALYLGESNFISTEISSRAAAIPNTQTRWPGGKVPYVIDLSVLPYLLLIQTAMLSITNATDGCVTFVPHSFQQNYTRIFAGQGCYSNVGMIGGQQAVSLGQGCMFRGTVVHELGHALGFFHEFNRSDRDQYLTINWENIQSGMGSQFVMLKSQENTLIGSFDYDSIMMYGNAAFSRDGQLLTMVAKNGQTLYDTYDKQGLTTVDANALKQMYCPS